MRIAILSFGSRGDIQPYVALGAGWAKAGHSVRLVTHGIFEAMARARGLDFAEVEGNPMEMVRAEEGRSWIESDRNPIHFVRGFRDLMAPVIRRGFAQSLEACRDADLIAASGVAFYVGYSVAEALGRPFLQAYLQPVHPTRAFPSALFPTPLSSRSRTPGWFNLTSHAGGGMFFWQLLRPVVNGARRETFGLPPLSVLGPFPALQRRRAPVLYGFSPSVLPPPPDWGDWIHVTGYWFLDEPEWSPPADLVDFLAAGPPPVYVGFGSMTNRDPEASAALVLEALRRSGQRGLLLRGWGGLDPAHVPENIHLIDEAPHAWLFPRMAAVVHHGGAGTTAAGLRAGVPNLVVPFFADQPFWGRVVHGLGVGPQPIPRGALGAGGLARAIRRAVEDPGMRARAAAVGERVRAEDGIRGSIPVIEASVAGQPDASRLQAEHG